MPTPLDPAGATRDASVKARIAEHFEAIGQDEIRAAEIYADDAVLVYVQSGERIAGKPNIVASRQAYPGRPAAFEVNRVSGSGDLFVAELTLRFDGVDPHSVAAILELRGDEIVSERLYIAEPWDPPAYRKPWVDPAPHPIES
jgi:ketosteroid isomerase-like protein